jgi:hypothetical protein
MIQKCTKIAAWSILREVFLKSGVIEGRFRQTSKRDERMFKAGGLVFLWQSLPDEIGKEWISKVLTSWLLFLYR